jgi:hypothetical protein
MCSASLSTGRPGGGIPGLQMWKQGWNLPSQAAQAA